MIRRITAGQSHGDLGVARDQEPPGAGAPEARRAEIFPGPVLTHALQRAFTPPMPRLAIDSYWRAHPVRADRLARALAARSGAPKGWVWRLGDTAGLAATFRAPPAPYREAAFARGGGTCCVCGQPVYRFGWHADLWGAGPNRNAGWHSACVTAWRLWNAPSDYARVLKRLQAHRCAATGARLWKTAEVDHRVPLFRVWREHRDSAWPTLLAYLGRAESAGDQSRRARRQVRRRGAHAQSRRRNDANGRICREVANSDLPHGKCDDVVTTEIALRLSLIGKRSETHCLEMQAPSSATKRDQIRHSNTCDSPLPHSTDSESRPHCGKSRSGASEAAPREDPVDLLRRRVAIQIYFVDVSTASARCTMNEISPAGSTTIETRGTRRRRRRSRCRCARRRARCRPGRTRPRPRRGRRA